MNSDFDKFRTRFVGFVLVKIFAKDFLSWTAMFAVIINTLSHSALAELALFVFVLAIHQWNLFT